MLTKAYYRIMRPEEFGWGQVGAWSYHYTCGYVFHENYCQSRSSLCRAFQILQKDLENLFEYIDPCDNNKSTYSHRTFELLLRTATEFEANCKGILKANQYEKRPNELLEDYNNRFDRHSLNITQYYKINQAMRLHEYTVRLNYWNPRTLEFKPFGEWLNGHSLSWYQSYNDVKHNRDVKLDRANLETVIYGVASVLCILIGQFGPQIDPSKSAGEFMGGEQWALDNSLFIIQTPFWEQQDRYQFPKDEQGKVTIEYDCYPWA